MKRDKSIRTAIDRREFLKRLAAGGTLTALALAGCNRRTAKLEQGVAAPGEFPTDRMTFRTTPSSGDRVSLLGYGCMRWPTLDSEQAVGENDLDQEQINRLVDCAIEHGVNYFDTSPVYCKGFSERATGIALKHHPREKFYIATKLSNFDPRTHGREASLAMYHNSFKELQVDYIDYYLLHGVGMGGMEALHSRYLDNGVLDFLLEERKAGRIRHLGFSYHGDIEVFDYLLSQQERYQWDFVQIQLNYVDWHHPAEANARNINAQYLYEELHRLGIPAVIMEPLLGGRLAKVPEHVADHLQERQPEASIASWAFRFAGTPEGVLTVLSGMTYMEHLHDNLRTYSPLAPLNEEELEYLKQTAALLSRYPTIPCNDCKYCMPCPYGIDIPGILLHYNRCVNEGHVVSSSADDAYTRARRAFLIGYDRSVPRLRQAAHCIGCGQCNEHCPQRIDIPRQLQRIDRYVEQLKRKESF